MTISIHQSMNTPTCQPQNDPDMIPTPTPIAGVITIVDVPRVVLDAEHHRTHVIVVATKVEMFRLEKMSSICSTRRIVVVVSSLSCFVVMITIIGVVVEGARVQPKAPLRGQGHHGVGWGPP